jgi:hypothetical protein
LDLLTMLFLFDRNVFLTSARDTGRRAQRMQTSQLFEKARAEASGNAAMILTRVPRGGLAMMRATKRGLQPEALGYLGLKRFVRILAARLTFSKALSAQRFAIAPIRRGGI